MPLQRILLSGASGMVGSAIAAGLSADGAGIARLVRRPAAGPAELQWDPLVGIADPGALEGLDAAIHLSGASVAGRRWTPEYREIIASSRIGSTRVLATALAGLRQRPRVLLVASATGIYGNRGDEVLDEDSAPGSGFLAEVCQEWEDAAQPATEAGIRVAHLRFGVVLGRGEGALKQMLPVFRLGLGGRLGSGRQWMSWIGVPDLVDAVRFVWHEENISGAVNVVAPNPVTNGEFTRVLARELHRPAILPAPAFALRAAFGAMADEALLASARVLPRKLSMAGFHFKMATIDSALRNLFAGK